MYLIHSFVSNLPFTFWTLAVSWVCVYFSLSHSHWCSWMLLIESQSSIQWNVSNKHVLLAIILHIYVYASWCWWFLYRNLQYQRKSMLRFSSFSSYLVKYQMPYRTLCHILWLILMTNRIYFGWWHCHAWFKNLIV